MPDARRPLEPGETKTAGLFRSRLTFAQRIRAHLAIFAGRLAKFTLRRLGRGGTALPGKLALRLDPALLSHLTAGRTVYLVTGTNGKTTTVRILCALLESLGHPIITNPSGANLDSGLTATLLDNLASLRRSDRMPAGNPAGTAEQATRDLAIVFEIDEAFFAKCAASLQPDVCVVTNFFRDQLDRYGELQHTRDLIAKGLAETQAQVILCADDSLCASLARGREAASHFFGLATEAMQPAVAGAVTESAYCTFCGSRYTYQARAYGHLGQFTCPGCGFGRPDPELSFTSLTAVPADGRTGQVPAGDLAATAGQLLRFNWQGQIAEGRLNIPGLHNGYNASAALLAALVSGAPFQHAVQALAAAQAAFGRMERFTVQDRTVCLILVKNPVGMDRALDFVSQAPDFGAALLLLNANDPDGRDVSWIWDVDFERRLLPGLLGVSGVRCHDLALRLQYAGKQPDELLVSSDHLALFDRQLARCQPGQCLYVLPNYTAMLDLRADLAARYKLKAFWS